MPGTVVALPGTAYLIRPAVGEDGRVDPFVKADLDGVGTFSYEKSGWIVPLDKSRQVRDLVDILGLHVYGRVRPKEFDPIEISAALPGGTMLPHQVPAVRFLLERKRALLADDMGLGKTISALAALHHGKLWPALLVVPSPLVSNWVSEAAVWIGSPARVLSGMKPDESRLGGNLMVIGYPVVTGWEEVLKNYPFKAVICDEFHFVKSKKSKRGRATQAVADGREYVFGLTGTPSVNRPDELIHQIRILQRLDEFGGDVAFAKRYCGAKKVQDGAGRGRWVLGSPQRLEELHRRLVSSFMMRRLKRDVLKDLPEKFTCQHVIDATDLSSYRKIEEELEQAAKGDWRDRNVRADVIAHISTLKKELGIQKVGPAIEWIKEMSGASDEKSIIFFTHREVGEILSQELGAPLIYGGTKKADRDRIKNEFQAGKHKHLVLSIRVGAVGLTLTAATNVIFAELDWVPADLEQASDRAHRIGQTKRVTVWLLVAADTIESIIVRTLLGKTAVTSVVNSGRYSPGIMAALTQSGMVSAEQ